MKEVDVLKPQGDPRREVLPRGSPNVFSERFIYLKGKYTEVEEIWGTVG